MDRAPRNNCAGKNSCSLKKALKTGLFSTCKTCGQRLFGVEKWTKILDLNVINFYN